MNPPSLLPSWPVSTYPLFTGRPNCYTWVVTVTDTHQEAERILTDLLRQAPVWRKLQMLGSLNRTANQLALEGLRDKYPLAAESELHRHLADLLLGPILAQKVYGPRPSQSQGKLSVINE